MRWSCFGSLSRIVSISNIPSSRPMTSKISSTPRSSGLLSASSSKDLGIELLIIATFFKEAVGQLSSFFQDDLEFEEDIFGTPNPGCIKDQIDSNLWLSLNVASSVEVSQNIEYLLSPPYRNVQAGTSRFLHRKPCDLGCHHP
ncbi:hypothetical protein ONS95_007800 [Cadophora gregata]|uniref:uncharacterized protein n=1 Tax=Cadophora gregata TaxID=51156 RepID=UPI0026DB278D|nr:uncharacterized protein ONS95_007800 [Cadophora gregata]KAK0118931.1 hypothetical protein ONS96_012006 [Cadophora gregata f. sp. sojae]KAK0126183.1 hypothetical protein ONS95_007800 [Cadophora gregata]